MAEPNTMNPYPYVVNNPLKYVDPLGLAHIPGTRNNTLAGISGSTSNQSTNGGLGDFRRAEQKAGWQGESGNTNSLVLTENEKKLGIKVLSIDGIQYYDYSTPINKMINENAKISFEHRLMSYEDYLRVSWYTGSYTDWLSGVAGTMWWFRDQVNHDAPWDIKREHRWKEQLPGVKYLGVEGKFILNGELITSEELGNITYGYWGSVVGLGDITLYWGGGAAKLGMSDPRTKESPYYGDDENDHWMIKKGIDWFYQKYPDYKPAYNGIPVP